LTGATMAKDAKIEKLKAKAEDMKRRCPNLSILKMIVVPTNEVEIGKAFIVMNRTEYLRELNAVRDSYYAAEASASSPSNTKIDEAIAFIQKVWARDGGSPLDRAAVSDCNARPRANTNVSGEGYPPCLLVNHRCNMPNKHKGNSHICSCGASWPVARRKTVPEISENRGPVA